MPPITLDLPPSVLDQARQDAANSEQRLEDYLASKLIGRNTSPLEDMQGLDLSALSDDQLMVLITAMAPPVVQDRLSELAHKSSAGTLTSADVDDYDRLLVQVHNATLLKAQALLAWKRRYGTLPPGFEAQ